LASPFGGYQSGGKGILHDGYEELRTYALTSIKVPQQPLGLDLWHKKGFLAWSAIVLSRDLAPEPARCAHIRPGEPDLANVLVLPVSNILMEWSDENVGFKQQ
jgi:hypothetical protein